MSEVVTPVTAAPKRRKSGRKALRARVVRVFADHRSPRARRYARIYRDLDETMGPLAGLARHVGSATAMALVDLQDARQSVEGLERRQRMSPAIRTEISRLRRRILALQRSFESGLKALRELGATKPRRQPTSGPELMTTVANGRRG